MKMHFRKALIMTQPSHRSSRVTSRTIVFLFAALLAACGADQSVDPGQSEANDPAEFVGDGPTLFSGWATGNGQGSAATPPSDDVKTGEESEAAGEGGRVEALQNCVYIDYCNEPGSRGTVCRAKLGCASRPAIDAECTRDAYAVCGAITYPTGLDWY